MQKNKLHLKKMLIALLVSIVLIIFCILKIFEPTIILRNNTNKVIYIHILESEYRKEPTIEELDHWKKEIIINPSENLKIGMSLKNLLIDKVMLLSISWTIDDNRIESKGGSASSVVDDTNGMCKINININNDGFKVDHFKNSWCYKRLMTIVEEK